MPSAVSSALPAQLLRRASVVLLCLAVVNFAASAGANTADFAGAFREVPIGGTLPDALLQGLNGPSQKLSAFRGRPLIINVWASWCGPCRAEMASLERLAWHDQAHYFSIIGISTDDYASQAKGFLKSANATISQFIDTDLQIESMLGAKRLPLTVLVDADGRVLQKVYGARRWDGVDALRLIDDAFHKRISRRTTE